MNKREKELVNNLSLINYSGKIKETINNVYGTYIIKHITKQVGDKTYFYTLKYEIKSHRIDLPFDNKEEIERLLRYGKSIASEILDNEMQELIDKYINITIKDMEINSFMSNWSVLMKDDGKMYIDINGNAILVKYYRLLPTDEFLSNYYSTDELKKMNDEPVIQGDDNGKIE